MRIAKKRAIARNLVLAIAVGLLALGSGAVSAGEGKYALGDIPLDPATYRSHLKLRSEAELLEALPSRYDAREEGIVTSPKNQGSCGSCWAHASVGAMESHMLKQFGFGPTNLSEQQLISCWESYYNWGCEGGNSSALLYWETKGPLYESCFPYTANDTTACKESACNQLGFHVVDWHTVSATPNEFKYSLYTYGPSYWRYRVYADFYTFWDRGQPGQVYVNTSSAFVGGHAVLLIGWDDEKQAYLCKNSWGTGGPNNDGTFWIAYSGHAYEMGFGMANFSLSASGLLPQAPTNLIATVIPPWQINLSWTDNSSNEDGFRIERSSGGAWSTLATVAANTTSYQDKTPTPGIAYSYRVFAYSAAGDSDPGNTASAMLPEIVGPLVYSGYRTDADNGLINCGETVGLTVMLENEGNTAVEGIYNTLYVVGGTGQHDIGEVSPDTSPYPDIAGGASAGNTQAFEFSVIPLAEHGHWIDFELAIDADNWSGGPIEFSLPILCAATADYSHYLPMVFK